MKIEYINKSKLNRNDDCHCGSGKKYKFCHMGLDRIIRLWSDEKCNCCGESLYKDFDNSDIITLFTNSQVRMFNYFKEYNLYLFSTITIGYLSNLEKKEIENGCLIKSDLMEIYKQYLTRETTDFHLKYCLENELYDKREEILLDIISAHFDKKYTLSIPASFTIIEGIGREICNLEPRASFNLNIDVQIFLRKELLNVAESATYFNLFVNNLFSGKGNVSQFNRNPVLHGLNLSYFSEEHSLILILCIFEFRQFLMWRELNIKGFK